MGSYTSDERDYLKKSEWSRRVNVWEKFKCANRLRLGSLSPLQSNIMLDQLDKYLEKRGCNFIRYADDFSIYTKSKTEAKSIGNKVYLFLRDKLELQINREKSGIRRPSNFRVLGHTFTSVYKKGSKGQYQLIVSKRSWAEFKRKLKRITKKTLGYSFAKRISMLKLIYRG